MLTKKDYCDYETCVALDDLGCPIPKYATINIHTKEKEWKMWFTLHEAQEWLREEKEIYVSVIPEYNEFRPVKGVKYRLEIAHWRDDEFGYETIEWRDEESPYLVITFDSYKEALSKGIEKATELLKDKNKQESPKNY